MASEKPTWSFKANSEQDAALRGWMGEKEERTKSDALSHFVDVARRSMEESDQSPSSLRNILSAGVVQMAVLAIVVLMLGPGLGLVSARATTVVGVGLLAIAFWTLVALRMGWVDRIHARVSSHLEWVASQREREVETEVEV